VAVSYPPILDQLGFGPPLGDHPVGGGCIADARCFEFKNGTRVFVKATRTSTNQFRREAEGLKALQECGAVRVAEVLAVDSSALVLEWIESATKKRQFFDILGLQLAQMHLCLGNTFGFPHDNYIGATPQPNKPVDGAWAETGSESEQERGKGDSWARFFLERRLRFQAELAEKNGHGSELLRLLDQTSGQVVDLLAAADEAASLLHGDLWGGNVISDERGEPCLIDPAVYYGHRETDLAMTRLFGGFGPEFYHAYEEAWPLTAGHEERLPLYQLYHLLNHLNLFGSAYYERCRQILRHYAAGTGP